MIQNAMSSQNWGDMPISNSNPASRCGQNQCNAGDYSKAALRSRPPAAIWRFLRRAHCKPNPNAAQAERRERQCPTKEETPLPAEEDHPTRHARMG